MVHRLKQRPVMTRLATLALSACALAGAPAASGGAKVTWKQASFPAAQPPAELPDAARSALEAWRGWAGERGYELHLDPEGRVLLATLEGHPRWRHQLQLVARTVELFEAALPLPPEAAAAPGQPAEPTRPSDGGAAPEDLPLPEDPESGPAPWELDGAPAPRTSSVQAPTAPTTWGAETLVPDTQTIVFLVLRTPADYASAVALLAREHPYLADWAESAGEATGFALQLPLAGSYVELAAGQEEWSPDNEVVHRIAQLLLLRRYGQQPHWLVRGWAWHAELELLGGIYCFPDRDEFVWATEHTGWADMVRARFEDRAGEPVAIEDFAAWPRGVWDAERARASWAAVRFLLRERPGDLPRILVRFRDVRDRENRVDAGGGTWQRRLDYEIALDAQAAILREVAGPSLFEDMMRAFLNP